jgi:hypothetical protein
MARPLLATIRGRDLVRLGHALAAQGAQIEAEGTGAPPMRAAERLQHDAAVLVRHSNALRQYSVELITHSRQLRAASR